MAARSRNMQADGFTRRAAAGGRARAAKLTPEQRTAIATKASHARRLGRTTSAREAKRMDSHTCGLVRFEDMGERLRLQIEASINWVLWNETQVETVITILREWRRLRKAAARARKRRQGGRDHGAASGSELKRTSSITHKDTYHGNKNADQRA